MIEEKTIVKCSHVKATKPKMPFDVIQRKEKINERYKQTYKESDWEKVLTPSIFPSFLDYVTWHFGLCRILERKNNFKKKIRYNPLTIYLFKISIFCREEKQLKKQIIIFGVKF